jgi:predicted anti-sigma-YlaC factor YlaD
VAVVHRVPVGDAERVVKEVVAGRAVALAQVGLCALVRGVLRPGGVLVAGGVDDGLTVDATRAGARVRVDAERPVAASVADTIALPVLMARAPVRARMPAGDAQSADPVVDSAPFTICCTPAAVSAA